VKVPLFDLTRQYEIIRDEVLSSLDAVFKSGNVVLSKNVELLEKEIASYVKAEYGIGVANGSDALVIALKSLGISDGDYVITTPFTFFATASCIVRNGATPIFVDINYDDFNINLDMVEDYLSGKTDVDPKKIKAVIPVHLFGRTVNLERLGKIKSRYNVKIIEDAAQSIGSTWKYSNGSVKFSASVGDLGIFSFFPTKNLGCYGDGGMIVTNNEKLYNTCKVLRKHGAEKKYYHSIVGFNSRLDEVQAAILRIKLKNLDFYTERRIDIDEKYKENFDKYGVSHIEYPKVYKDHSHVYHQYVVRVKNGGRDSLREFLSENGIGTSIYYPLPLHKQESFKNFVKYYDLPVAEKACKEVLALPIFPELRNDEIEYVVKKIKEWEDDFERR
jgi:dTDP-4-amino-4,6-dideoxygalactose transaminase